MLTLGQVQETLPANFRNNMTQDMDDQLNALSKDPEEARYMRENFVSFASVLQEGRFKVGDYVKAVMYVSHKVMGKSNHDAYKMTFPERYQPMVDAMKPQKDIASIISAYNRGQLVTMITERAMVPIWLMNQDVVQQAINTQVEIMSDINHNARDRTAAANSLLTHLKKPDVVKAELKIELAAQDGMAAMEAALVEFSSTQLEAIEHNPNVTANHVAALPMKSVN
jgi:hypothetical protein